MYRTAPGAQAPLVSDQPCAIQVVALFHDTVLLVRQLDDPMPRRGAGRILALLGLGAATQWAALVLARLCGLADFALPLAIGLTFVLVLALAMVERGIFGRIGLRRAPRFLLGEVPGSDLPLVHPALPDGAFPLVRWSGRDYEFVFSEAMAGEVRVGAERDTLQQLIEAGHARPLRDLPGCFALPLTPRVRVHLRFGDHAFIVQSVVASPPLRASSGSRWRGPFARWAGLSLLAHAVFMCVVWAFPPHSGCCQLDLFSTDTRHGYAVQNSAAGGKLAWWQVHQRRFAVAAANNQRLLSGLSKPSLVVVDLAHSRGVSDKVALGHEVFQHLEALQSCSLADLQQNGAAKGAITLRLHVDAAGRVVATRVRSSTLDDQVNDCVAEALLHWRFPLKLDARSFVATVPLRYL